MAEVDELRDAIEREYPRYDERTGHWDDVLHRAATARPPRLKWVLRGAVAAAAATALALALIAPWEAKTGIVDRALAAVGDGPVLHVIVRTDIKGKLVDLKTGRSRSVYDNQELWWDPARGLHQVQRFAGTAYSDSLARGLPRIENDPLPVGFVTGYREALESGRAENVGDGEIAGHEVTWIRFREDGPEGPTFEVAVDRQSAEPVYTRYKPGGAPAGWVGRLVLLAESLPSGAGDFDPEALPPRPVVSLTGLSYGTGTPKGFDARRARAILGQPPLWLGSSYAGKRFEGLQGAWVAEGRNLQHLRFVGVDVVYGRGANPPFSGESSWVRLSEHARLEFEVGFMEPNEDKLWRAIRPGFVLVYAAPEAQLAQLPSSDGSKATITSGYLTRNGLYVRVTAPSEKLVISAARALRPMS